MFSSHRCLVLREDDQDGLEEAKVSIAENEMADRPLSLKPKDRKQSNAMQETNEKKRDPMLFRYLFLTHLHMNKTLLLRAYN